MSTKTATPILFSRSGRDYRPLTPQTFNCDSVNGNSIRNLRQLGIVFEDKVLRGIMDHYAANMDSIQPTISTATIATPVQFLQNWLPGIVHVVTNARKIDDLIGIDISGSFEMAEIVQQFIEWTASSVPYGDFTQVPLSDWNPGYLTRNVVRFEQGMQVGMLESMTAAKVNINTDAEKRNSALEQLEIRRNSVGFFGYNNGNNNTYGLLNEPNLPSYITLPNGAAGTPTWSTKTYLEITKDIRNMMSTLRNQSGERVDPNKDNTTLALATSVVDYLSVTSDFGNSVRDWLTTTYPKCRVESAPEFDNANGGANVGYLYADTVNDASTDNRKTFIQSVQAKTFSVGVQKNIKSYEEDYANAMAGVLLKRPFAVVRRSGF